MESVNRRPRWHFSSALSTKTAAHFPLFFSRVDGRFGLCRSMSQYFGRVPKIELDGVLMERFSNQGSVVSCWIFTTLEMNKSSSIFSLTTWKEWANFPFVTLSFNWRRKGALSFTVRVSMCQKKAVKNSLKKKMPLLSAVLFLVLGTGEKMFYLFLFCFFFGYGPRFVSWQMASP